MKLRYLWVAILVLFSLVAAGCGDDDDNGSSDDDSAQTDDGGTDDGGEPVAGGSLSYGTEGNLTNLDPDKATVGGDNVWLFPAYDRLVHLTPGGDFIPGLAEDWTFSEDGLTLTLNLREGVKFHDGSDFDADVVVTNIDRSKNLENSVNASALGAIESVEAVDATTVQINLTEPAASIVGILSDKPGIMISGQALADGVDLSSEAVGAGMFTLTSYQPGDRVVFAKFAEYWDADNVLLDDLTIVELTDSTSRLSALRDGQVDAARIDPDGADAAEGDGFVIERSPTLEVVYIPFRFGEDSPWRDQTVREAMTYAIDKQGLVDALLGGAGTVVSQMFPPGYFAASPDVANDSRPFDVDKAKQLLADAGYPDGFDIALGTGGDTTLGVAVQAQWAQVGIDLEIISYGTTGELINAWFGGEFDMFLGPWSGRPDPNVTNDFLFAADSTFINYTGYDVPRINELLTESEAASGDERTALLQELAEVTEETAFNIPLYAPDFVLAADEKVQGLDIYTTLKIEFRGVSVSE
jgi:peptide/nickel transport system substrate-binding protein